MIDSKAAKRINEMEEVLKNSTNYNLLMEAVNSIQPMSEDISDIIESLVDLHIRMNGAIMYGSLRSQHLGLLNQIEKDILNLHYLIKEYENNVAVCETNS